ncbi:hypothetical protein XENOCAPTIV_017099 [Xenoophorus captivus]|uniref:Uncharacterized protein n=1 Tax=Xenoophorus captivus TaxID=1517983 RepID=A0ABV0SAV6_9TELE
MIFITLKKVTLTILQYSCRRQFGFVAFRQMIRNMASLGDESISLLYAVNVLRTGFPAIFSSIFTSFGVAVLSSARKPKQDSKRNWAFASRFRKRNCKHYR